MLHQIRANVIISYFSVFYLNSPIGDRIEKISIVANEKGKSTLKTLTTT